VRVGVATSEPEVADDDGRLFWRRVEQLQLQEVRLVAYRDNPLLLDRLRRTIPLRPSGVRVSVVLIDSPGASLVGFPEWAAIVADVLPDVYRWIVWNEPNAHAFWPYPHGGSCERRAATYARFLNDVTAAIRRARPRAVVSAFGLAASHTPVRFLRAALRAGSRVEGLSAHLYPGSAADGIKGSLALLRRLQALVPRTPVFVDEYGWNAGRGCTEERQADLYRDLLLALRPVARTALVYRLQDGEGWRAGPYRPDGSRRPCWRTIRQAAIVPAAG
jgi:hypothetical protein